MILLGVFLIISSAAMTLIVRFGGQMSDRFQSRWLVMIGMFVQLTVMLSFAHLSELDAYQKVFMVLAIFPVLGMVVGFGLREKRLK